MVVNASAKLQSFMRHHGAEATPRITMFVKLVSELMDEIFFVPQGYHSPLDDLLTFPVPAPSVGTVSRTRTTSHGSGQSSASFDSIQQDLDVPEQPDEDDGLTDSEFRLLAQQARDPKLKPRDRSNAAAMLIGGAWRLRALVVPFPDFFLHPKDLVFYAICIFQLLRGDVLLHYPSRLLTLLNPVS
ncbi:hypothetical protein M413DRAFT_13495 [Hebeloma cylindrosporum]|uniref:Uncharacterized protein n=1 Tax=Hebeloma cylindrosporum TaxID=76867 RepID=A0A0C3BYM8_HEBCY|nr:hypothetical protein M413DRAFT_13495 [Hebeloma cylindrosporum h7]